MRIQTKHVDKLVKDVQALSQGGIPTLIKACNGWTQAIKWNYDAETVAWRREKLEKELKDFRAEIGAIYDHMSERGLK